MRRSLILLALASATVLPITAVGCGGDDTSATGTTDATSTTGTPTTATGTTTTTTTSTGTGTGGEGGAGGGTTATTTTTTTATTGAGGGSAGDHLVISEIGVAPVAAEFVEIWNPTAAAIDLSDYYLSDNSTYVDLASGGAWAPITMNAGTDFLARFPLGTSIPADGVLLIAFNQEFTMSFPGVCPDFVVSDAAITCGGAMIPKMLETEMESITDISGLSDAREMVVLFTWDGDTTHLLQDADYVTWGPDFQAGTRVDKTMVAGYQPDTAPDMQRSAAEPDPNQSIERCSLDADETLAGGNGITGHDETSEDLGASFVAQAASPGTKNSCL